MLYQKTQRSTQKVFLRSLSEYKLKQLLFEIEVNSGRIFTEPLQYFRFTNGGETQIYTGHFVLFGSRIIHSVGSE